VTGVNPLNSEVLKEMISTSILQSSINISNNISHNYYVIDNKTKIDDNRAGTCGYNGPLTHHETVESIYYNNIKEKRIKSPIKKMAARVVVRR
jgi:hypothetical protein